MYSPTRLLRQSPCQALWLSIEAEFNFLTSRIYLVYLDIDGSDFLQTPSESAEKLVTKLAVGLGR